MPGRRRARLVIIALAYAALLPPAFAKSDCVAVGRWFVPGAPAQPVAQPDVVARAAARRVVLLGEQHDSAEDHRWQLQTIAALHALRPDLVIALEMFPRRVQPALDRWVAGELSEEEFLAAAEWRTVWTFDAQLYMPIFHFARMHRVPMIAINVDQPLIRAVSKSGFDAVPEEKREGISRPAAPTAGYIEMLREVYAEHERDAEKRAKPERDDPAFRRFVETQLVWDRAMAQGIVDVFARAPKALAVGIMGRGHVIHGHGVPHQLRDLRVSDAGSLLTWEADADCSELVPGIADAVFGIAPATAAAPAQRPRLGVSLEPVANGVAVRRVEKGSIAEAAGIRSGDIVIEIAGRRAAQPADVADTVQRQAPGTWLPLRIERRGARVELVAKFPPLAQ